MLAGRGWCVINFLSLVSPFDVRPRSILRRRCLFAELWLPEFLCLLPVLFHLSLPVPALVTGASDVFRAFDSARWRAARIDAVLGEPWLLNSAASVAANVVLAISAPRRPLFRVQ